MVMTESRTQEEWNAWKEKRNLIKTKREPDAPWITLWIIAIWACGIVGLGALVLRVL